MKRRTRWLGILVRMPISPKAKLVGFALARYADARTGEDAQPGIERLAGDTGLSEKSVRRGLAELVDADLIIQQGRGGSPTRVMSSYALTISRACVETIVGQAIAEMAKEAQS